MQSFFTTHFPPFALWKWYVWKRRRNSSKKVHRAPRLPRVVLIEFAQRSTRSTRPRRKIILGPTQRIEDLQGNLEERRWLQNSWHTTFDSRTAGYKSAKQGQEVDREVRDKDSIPSGLEPRRRRSTSLAKNRRNWSPTRPTPRSSSFGKTLPNSNPLIAIPTWEIGIVYSIPGYVIKTNSSRGANHGQRMCYPSETDGQKRHVRESTETTQQYFRDGTPANRTETRDQTSGGKKRT